MSKPKKLSENKEWVLIGHYAEAMEKIAALQAEKEAETKATFDAIRLITQLRDENERLRKAGYAMAIKINVHGIADKFTDSQKLVDDWSAAAKEGRDAK